MTKDKGIYAYVLTAVVLLLVAILFFNSQWFNQEPKEIWKEEWVCDEYDDFINMAYIAACCSDKSFSLAKYGDDYVKFNGRICIEADYVRINEAPYWYACNSIGQYTDVCVRQHRKFICENGWWRCMEERCRDGYCEEVIQ